MKMRVVKLATMFLAVLTLSLFGAFPAWAKGPGSGGGGGGGGGGKPGGETAGNNLSYPVIWAEGVTKTLPGAPGMDPYLNGEWWYQWGTNGTDPDVTPASCLPDPDEGDTLLNPDGLNLCDDEEPDSVDLENLAGVPAAENPLPLVKAYIQKDPMNIWQAESADWSGNPLYVRWIDWGDNLESVDWYTRSQVRTEVVLFQDIEPSMTEYEMRHVYGWGIDEVHGLAATLDEQPAAMTGPGTRATVYSPCARLTIQKLLTLREAIPADVLTWRPGEGWVVPDFDKTKHYNRGDIVTYKYLVYEASENIPFTSVAPPNTDYWSEVDQCEGAAQFDPYIGYEQNDVVIVEDNKCYMDIEINPRTSSSPDDASLWGLHDGLIKPPIFNKPVYEGGDGPGYYSAEINVKGRIIYGYTWNVRTLNDDTGGTAAGDYRITFSFDETCGTANLNTFFVDGVTEIMVPLEEELAAAALAEESESTEGGATAELDYENNLTYIDVRILERGGGGGSGKGSGKK